METTRLFKIFLFLTLMMGLGTAWGQVARVTVDGGTPQTFTQLVNQNPKGAFNYVAGLGNATQANPRTVLIEILEDCTLSANFSFSTTYTNITIKTGEGLSTKSLIHGNYNNGRLITFSGTSSTLTFEDIILDGNNQAGGLLSTSQALNINSDVILKNCSVSGNGGLIAVTGGTTTIDGAILQGGSASGTNGRGGLIHVSGGNLSIANATLENGTALNGGCIWFGGTTLSINNTTIQGTNSATTNGGVLYVNAGTVTMSGSTTTLKNGTAAAGGIVYVNGGTVNIQDATLESGTATSQGGIISSNAGNVTLNISHATLKNGSADNGGIIYFTGTGATLTIEESTLQDVTTATNGGILYMNGGTVNINEGSLLQNATATTNGGLAHVNGGNLNVNGATLQNGTAANGAIISKAGTGTLNITGSEINGGTATSALIDNTGNGAVTITSTTINAQNATGTLINKAGTGALNIGDTESPVIINGGSTTSTLINITAGTPTITNTTINGQTATGTLINDTGTAVLSITNSEINGSTVSNSNNLINKYVAANSDGVVFTGTTFNGNNVTGNLISISSDNNGRTVNVTFNNCTVNGATSGSGSLVSKTTEGTFSATNGTSFNGKGSTGTMISLSNSDDKTTFMSSTINGGTATGDLFNDGGTGELEFNNSGINGSTIEAANTLITKSNTGKVTFGSSFITRNQSKGYGFINTSSGEVVFNGSFVEGSDNALAENSLIKMGSGQLTLNNTIVSGHTVSALDICAVDASTGTANVNVNGTTTIFANTSNGVAANLSVNGDNRLKLTNSLTGTIGVTTPQGVNQQFAILGDGSYTGYENLKNDTDSNLIAGLSGTTTIKWLGADSKYQVVSGNNYSYYSTLKSAVEAAPNNSTINSLVNEDIIEEAITTINNKAITIQPGSGIDHLTLHRDTSVSGDLITANAALTLNNITLDGGNVEATGSIIKVNAGALTLNNTTINGGKTTGNIINDTGTAAMTINDSEINGSTVENTGNLIRKYVSGVSGNTLTFTNTTFNACSLTGDLISVSNSGNNRTVNVSFDNCTVNGATTGNGSLVSKTTDGSFSATNGTVFNGNGSTGVLVNLSKSDDAVNFTSTTINGGNSTGDLLIDAGTGTLSFDDCSIEGSKVAANNTLVTKSANGAVTFTNTTMTRNKSNGYGFIKSSGTGAVSFSGCTIDGSENTSATSSLIKVGADGLTLTNTIVTGHTVSTADVCAVDASSVTGNNKYIDVSGETSISGNSSNNQDANLKVTGTNHLRIPAGSELSLTVGVTSTDKYNSGNQFAVLGNGTTSLGYQYFQNDKDNTLFGKKSGTTNIVWGTYTSPGSNSKFRIFKNEDYTYYETLKTAIEGSNGMTGNVTIQALVANYTATSEDAVAFTASHNVIICPDKESAGERFTIKRGAVGGDLLTFENTGANTLTLINTTLDGTASVTTTGSLIKMGGANILTLNNSSVINNAASSSEAFGINASNSTGKVNLVGEVNVKNNTANGAKANLSVNGTTRLTLTGNISGEVGVTTPQKGGTQFATGNISYSGFEGLINDEEANMRPYYSSNTAISWQYRYKGLIYTFGGTPITASIAGYDLTYTDIPTIDVQVPYYGEDLLIKDLTYFGSAATLKNKNLLFSEAMLNKMANNAVIGLPDVVTHFTDAIIEAVEGYTQGVNNANAPGTKNVWKKAEYDQATNKIEYTLKYLQLMTQDQPLDFIFSIDQTSTMCTSDATANGITAPRVMWMMALLQKTAYELISRNGDGYDNKVAFIPWGNTTPNKSPFMSTDAEITTWFSGSDAYSHAAEGTNHALAAQACVEMANVSLNHNHRNPVVIYMSDFQANANTNRNNVYVKELRETSQYKTYAINIFADASAYGNYYQNSGVYFANDPSEFMGVFSAIIKDAIGYYLNKNLVIEDGLSTPLAGTTPTEDSADGLLETTAGQATWTLGKQEPLLNAATLYTSTFTVQLDDDAVYSGQMPTNSGLVVNSDGSPVNSIDGGSIITRSAVTLVLKSVNTLGTPIADATFTLTHGSNTWNLTTDANGQIVLPWGENDVVGATTAESKFAFAVEQVYTLTQNSTSMGFVMPTDSWTLTVGSDYKITASGAMPAMEAHAGKLEIYNETVKIARVSNDNGATWTYHEYLINSSGTGSAQGAFDYANTISGNVIIETLLETAVIGSEDRYALTEGFTFNGTGLTGLTLRTTDDAGYNSTEFTTTISRGDDFGSLITFNKTSATMIIQNLTLDGNNGSYTCNTNGGLVNVTKGTLSLADGSTLQNSTVDASHNGGGVYLGSGGNLTVSGVVIVDNNMKGSVLNNVYLNDATNQYVTIGGMQELKRCSHIGITKTIGYTNDSNDALHTVIAQGGGSEPANYCNRAFYNGCFFDDLDIYKVYCLSYGSEYATNKLYFIDSWEGHVSAAVAGTDYVLNSDYVTEVKTATGLAYFAKDVNSGKDYSGKTVTLSSDIDLSGHYWVPIGQIYSNGCTSYSGSAFTGTFDGQGKRINNMMSILPCASLGLFGEVDDGDITNTFVESGNLVGTRKDGAYMGGLVGYLHDGSITYSEAAVTMGQTTRQYIMGGLVGSATNSTSSSILIHSSMAMPVMNEGFYMGGLVGILGNYHQGSIANCFVNAEMNKDSETYSVGGIVASHEEQAVFTNCYVRLQGNLPDPSTDRFGWLAGRTDGGTYSNCYIPEGKNQFGNGYSAESVTHCGTYGPTTLVGGKYGFRHRDLQMTVADITDLSEYNDTPEGGLTAILNSWVDEQAAANGYARWSRTMASPINGDYPILMLPDFESAASLTDSVFIAYGEVNDLIQYANANTSDGGNVYLYGDIDNDGVTLTQSTEDNVRLYIHEDIGVVQDDDFTVNARVGVTFKNDRDNESDPNWHTFASALNNAPTGIVYHTSEDAEHVTLISQDNIPESDFTNTVKMDPPKTTWNTTAGNTGYFPTNTPYGTWKGTADPNGFFDFYAYCEPYYHWINLKREGSDDYMDHWHIDTYANGDHPKITYKEEADNGNKMINGKGYLMAISAESMLMTDGQLNNGKVTVTLDKTDPGANTPVGKVGEDGKWRSINLVGNPYQSYLNFDQLYEKNGNTALIENTFAVRDDNGKEYLFYTYEASDNADYMPSNLIHPHQGFFVKVKDSQPVGSYTLAFDNDMRLSGNLAEDNPFRGSHHNYPLVNLLCFDSHGHRDLTTVEVNRPELGGGQKMPKLVNGDALLYAHFEEGSYQTLFTPMGVNEVPVRFEAQNNGVFTLQWNTLHGDFHYLHLIDNITGADIDMLSTDEYQFEGRSSDYTSRFRLVFHCTGVEEQYDDNTGSENFAFIHDGQLIIEGTGTLQIIDMLGHQLLSKQLSTLNSQLSTPNTPGVYILRLINGSSTKTQKLIINK